MMGGFSMSELEALENIMTGYAGFFAKSVIKHQMKLMGMEREDCTPAEVQLLGEKVITVAIFDEKLQVEARRELKRIAFA